jgi:SanA protein
MRKILRLLAGSLGTVALALLALRLYTTTKYRAQMHSAADAPAARVAIVFGAGLRRDGSPTAILYDRVATAVELYRQGKAEKLLLSGDNRFADYNEPEAMRQAALDLGVPEAAIVLDYAGRRTYDTCYRAKEIFGVTHALLVTQNFHLPRALMICEALGLEAAGVRADRRPYSKRAEVSWNLREVFATAAAWWDAFVARPVPVLGERIPIP